MHIPDGFVRTDINVLNYAIALGAGALVCVKAKKTWTGEQVPLIGVTAAFIFAAQMINFPVAGGTSGHFLGALFAALLVGPLASFLIMVLVLTVQCLVFADGGLMALGTNVVNMGLVGGVLAYYFFRIVRFSCPANQKGFLAAAAIASWSSVVAASAACACELALSKTSPFQIVFPTMVAIHGLIGAGEAIITVAAISFILKVRPELVNAWKEKDFK